MHPTVHEELAIGSGAHPRAYDQFGEECEFLYPLLFALLIGGAAIAMLCFPFRRWITSRMARALEGGFLFSGVFLFGSLLIVFFLLSIAAFDERNELTSRLPESVFDKQILILGCAPVLLLILIGWARYYYCHKASARLQIAKECWRYDTDPFAGLQQFARKVRRRTRFQESDPW